MVVGACNLSSQVSEAGCLQLSGWPELDHETLFPRGERVLMNLKHESEEK